MLSNTKKFAKKAARGGLKGVLKVGKKVAKSNPRLKNFVKFNVAKFMAETTLNPQNADFDAKYNRWVLQHYPDAVDFAKMRSEIKTMKYTPLISVVIPVYNTPEELFRETIASVESQAYENWELILVDDCSPSEKTRYLIKEFAKNDERIKYKFLAKNHHIAGATNEGFKIAKGEFIALFDHDDLLWPNAFFEVVKALNSRKDLDFIYTDEDIVSEDRHHHYNPHFKPDFNEDLLISANYVSHLSVIRKSLIDKVGGEKTEYNGAQDLGFELALFRETTPDKIHHVPKILYSWRAIHGSTAMSISEKPYIFEAQRRVLTDHFKALGHKEDDFVINQDGTFCDVDFKVKGNPKISIVIPNKNLRETLKTCLDSIFAKTTYDNYEIVVVDTGSDDPKLAKLYDDFSRKHNNFKKVEFIREKFSYSDACNFGAEKATGEYLLMLNNDTEVITKYWIEKMLGDAQRPEIGVVGAKLLYPDGNGIQHAGVVVGLGGPANNLSMKDMNYTRYVTRTIFLDLKRNSTAVTAACMMISREKFDEVGGFDQELSVYYNDVDLSLKMVKAGYRNIYNPNVQLYHYESKSLGVFSAEKSTKSTEQIAKLEEATQIFWKKWPEYKDISRNHDRFYNPNLSRGSTDLDIEMWGK